MYMAVNATSTWGCKGTRSRFRHGQTPPERERASERAPPSSFALHSSSRRKHTQTGGLPSAGAPGASVMGCGCTPPLAYAVSTWAASQGLGWGWAAAKAAWGVTGGT